MSAGDTTVAKTAGHEKPAADPPPPNPKKSKKSETASLPTAAAAAVAVAASEETPNLKNKVEDANKPADDDEDDNALFLQMRIELLTEQQDHQGVLDELENFFKK